MKNKVKLLGWLIAIAAAAGIYVAAVSSLRGQMEEQLSAACKRPVTLRSARIILPPGIRLTGLEVPAVRGEERSPIKVDMIQARLAASAGGQGQLGGELEVIHPQIYIEWTLQAKELSAMGVNPFSLPPAAAGPPVSQARITGGEMTFIDRLAVPNVFWNFRDVSFSVRPGARPREQEFALSGRLTDEAGRDLGTVNAQGTRLPEGPLDAVIHLSHADLGKLAPYLRRVLGAAPARGAVEAEIRLTLYKGTLMAHNDLIVAGAFFSDNQPTTLGPDGNRLVELLEDREGKVHLSFIVAGDPRKKMDWSDLAAGAMREAMRQAMSRSIQQVLSDTEQKKPVEELMRKKLDTLDR